MGSLNCSRDLVEPDISSIGRSSMPSKQVAIDGLDKEVESWNRDFEYYENRHPHKPLTALQKHVLFWDRDCDGIIWPWHVYRGFRELGFNILFSLGSFLIPLFFSYPTRFRHSWFPDPLFRIYLDHGNASIHGSDTGTYNFDGNFSQQRFDEMFEYFDRSGTGGLSAEDLFHLLHKNRDAWDLPGWCFAFMEWWTTWLLMQKDGRVGKDDLAACYDGTLFFKIRRARLSGRGWNQGYGFGEFFEAILKAGTWRHWEIEKRQSRKPQ